MTDQAEPLKLRIWGQVCVWWTVLATLSFGYLPIVILVYAPIQWYWPLLIAMTTLSVASAWNIWEGESRALLLVCVLGCAGVAALLTRHDVDYRETPTGRYLKIESDKWLGKKKVRFVSEQEYGDATAPADDSSLSR